MFMMPFSAVAEMHPERYRKQGKTKHKIFLGLIITLILVLASVFAFGQDAIKVNPSGLSWDKAVDNDLSGYKIYWGNSTRDYQSKINLPLSGFTDKENPTFDIDYSTAKDGHYYYAVTAYDEVHNESGYSNEVDFIIDKSSPENIKNLRTIGGLTIVINVGTP